MSAVYAGLTLFGPGVLLLRSSYSAALNEAFKTRVPPAFRGWDGTARGWRVDAQFGQVVADLCTAYLGVTPSIPSAAVAVGKPPRETRLFEVRYLGKGKARVDGSWSATGWVRAPQPPLPLHTRGRGAWDLTITLQALRRFFEPSYGLRDPGDDEDEAAPAAATAAPPSLYDVLGVTPDADDAALKRGYRVMARQWHPDVCKEPDAHEKFIALQEALALLADPDRRQRYDRGLRIQAQTLQAAAFVPPAGGPPLAALGVGPYGWSPPQRSGYFLVAGYPSVRAFKAVHILDARDIVDPDGRILVASWPKDGDDFDEVWVDP